MDEKEQVSSSQTTFPSKKNMREKKASSFLQIFKLTPEETLKTLKPCLALGHFLIFYPPPRVSPFFKGDEKEIGEKKN